MAGESLSTYPVAHGSGPRQTSHPAVDELVEVTSKANWVDRGQASPSGQQRLGRELRRDVWPKLCHGSAIPGYGDPLATGDPIDDIATVVSQIADGHFGHLSTASRVRHEPQRMLAMRTGTPSKRRVALKRRNLNSKLLLVGRE